jgi:hypothetical protein
LNSDAERTRGARRVQVHEDPQGDRLALPKGQRHDRREDAGVESRAIRGHRHRAGRRLKSLNSTPSAQVSTFSAGAC